MARKTVGFEIDGLDEMIGKVSGVAFDLAEATRTEWALASEAFFSASQEHVHVLSGRLKRSGELSSTRRRGGTLESTVTYGGKTIDARGGRVTDHDGTVYHVPSGPRKVDYALYEEARRGHSYLAAAMDDTRHRFLDAMYAGWNNWATGVR